MNDDRPSDLEIARDDIALSAIAGGGSPDSDDPTLLLLQSFRADLDAAVAVPTAVESVRVVAPAKRRSASLVALAAAAGIVFGGITAGAIAFSDRPGDVLYTAHAAVFGKAETRTSDVHALLDEAAGLLARGDRAGARRLLGRATTLVGSVPESDRPSLRRRIDDLTAYAAEPVRPTTQPTARPSPSATPERTRTPEPSESESEDNSGSGSSNSGSGSSKSGSSDSPNSGSGGSDDD